MSAVENINPETAPIPPSWVPRVITGGKGPPGGDEPPWDKGPPWLTELQVGTVFACRETKYSIDWEVYTLFHKFERIYLLKIEAADGKIYERRVHPEFFSNRYRDHEVIMVFDIQEAPEGDKDETADGNGDRAD